MSMNVAQLVDTLTKASDAYYHGRPIMSDAKFDRLEDQLRKLDPTNAFFKKVGAPVPTSKGWKKVAHGQPMGSLNKAQNKDDLKGWLTGLGVPRGKLVIADKLDGISCSLRYENGKLVQALTRGDGTIGEDITVNVQRMKGAVKQVPGNFTGHVRGEIVCCHDDFKQHFPHDSNPRNTASGVSKRQSNAGDCRYLTIYSYVFVPDDGNLPTKEAEFAALRKHGFKVPEVEVVMSMREVYETYDKYVNGKRASLNYEIDGLVVTVDDRSTFEGLGERNHRPRGAIAMKFPHEEKETTLRNIRWQVGPSGRVTPVAEFDPVVLVSANVKQASLHNISNIEEIASALGRKCLAVGDKILASRRNDVIPFVESALAPTPSNPPTLLTTPTHCPDCSSALTRDGEYLVCPNNDGCPRQISGAIKQWVKKIGVLHFGESLIDAACEAGLIADCADLYTLTEDQLATLELSGRRVGNSTAKRALGNLHKAKVLDLHVIVGSLGIPLNSRSMVKTYVDAGFDSLQKLWNARPSQLAAIPGVGSTKANAFVQGVHARIGLIAKLVQNGVEVKKQAEGPLKGKKFCLTGFRDPNLAKALEAIGGEEKSSVSKSLDYLVLLDKNSTSGKAKKARTYNDKGQANIILLSKEEAWQLAKP